MAQTFQMWLLGTRVVFNWLANYMLRRFGFVLLIFLTLAPKLVHAQYSTSPAEHYVMQAKSKLASQEYFEAKKLLQQAIEADDENIEALYLLSGYYLDISSRYRKALQYAERAIKVFKSRYGEPPHSYLVKDFYRSLLQLLHQCRLSLDDYDGALEVLNEIENGPPWLDSSKAWVLMKQGRVEESLEFAEAGYRQARLYGSNVGHALNILGILQSMNNRKDEAVKTFQEAIKYEKSLGLAGQPGTPLNNIGEVYREIFDDDRALESFAASKRGKDGCDHVLSSLNLSILKIEHLDFVGAEKSLDSFLQCFKQFTLKSDEEHRALVELMRARIFYHRNDLPSALEMVNASLDHIQWFGKIGTDAFDLLAGALLTKVQILDGLIVAKEYDLGTSWWQKNPFSSFYLRVQGWWLIEHLKEILIRKLNDFEDLEVRNTDSIIEYGTLGEYTRYLPSGVLKRQVSSLDNYRFKTAKDHYQNYLAWSLFEEGKSREALEVVDAILPGLRQNDKLLKLNTLWLKWLIFEEIGTDNRKLAIEIFRMNPAMVAVKGIKLPVESALPLDGTPFAKGGTCKLDGQDAGDTYQLTFSCIGSEIVVKGRGYEESMVKLVKKVFTAPK